VRPGTTLLPLRVAPMAQDVTSKLSELQDAATGAFDQDPAIQLPMLPGLRRVRSLAEHEPGSRERRFLETHLVRPRNRVNDALLEASQTVEGLVR
jgi:hypothetical protein